MTASPIVMPEAAAGITNTKERVYLYDWMRIITTFVLVIAHSTYLQYATEHGSFTASIPANVSPVYYSFLFVAIDKIVRWCPIIVPPVFCIVSGAVLRLKPIGRLDSFFVSKLKRLIIPYFLGGILFMLPVKYLVGFYTKGGLLRALKGFWTGSDSGHLWFLFALFWSMLLFVGAKKVLRHLHCNSEAVLFMFAVAVHICSQYLPVNTFSIADGMRLFLYIVCGYIFEGLRRKHFADISVKLTVALLVFSSALMIVNIKTAILQQYASIAVAAVMCYSAAVLLTKLFPNATKSKFIKMLMRTQILIYILHDPLQYVILKIFTGTEIMTTGFGCYLYLFCRTIGMFFVSMLLGELVLLFKKALLILFGWLRKNKTAKTVT